MKSKIFLFLENSNELIFIFQTIILYYILNMKFWWKGLYEWWKDNNFEPLAQDIHPIKAARARRLLPPARLTTSRVHPGLGLVQLRHDTSDRHGSIPRRAEATSRFARLRLHNPRRFPALRRREAQQAARSQVLPLLERRRVLAASTEPQLLSCRLVQVL